MFGLIIYYPFLANLVFYPVADPGFPVGGGVHPLGGCGPLTRALFSENVYENERIGSHREGCVPGMPPSRSTNATR